MIDLKAIGIRVTPQMVYYTIVEELQDGMLSISEDGVEKIIMPVALDIPNRLAFIRQTLISLINEFKVTKAGIRITEHNAKTINIERVSIEGVIQELLANSTVEKYFTGAMNTIAKYLEVKSNDLSEAFKGKLTTP